MIVTGANTVKRWAIVGVHGLYVGQCLRRRDAIDEHVRARFVVPSDRFPTEKKAWAYCRKKGDRAVKISIVWKEPSR